MKPAFHLIPAGALLDVATALARGAAKWPSINGREPWQDITTEEHYSALMRHLTAMRLGEPVDSDSGELHATHALCRMLFIAQLARDSACLDAILAPTRYTEERETLVPRAAEAQMLPPPGWEEGQ